MISIIRKGLSKRIVKLIALPLIILIQFLFVSVPKAQAATSPTLGGSSGYSVLGGEEVTNVGTTTTNGAVGVSPGTSITGGTITAGGGTHSNDASAIAAQADTVSVYTALDAGANADANCIGGILADNTDLTTLSPLGPGVYCSAGSFRITGNLTLTGSSGVWVFKTVSTLITSNGSSVTGGDPCNVWWRVGSAATLGTTTAFIGNIVTADVADTTALNTGATVNGRVLAQAAQTVTLAGNTFSLTCSAAAAASSTVTSSAPSAPYCEDISEQVIPPSILESRRIDSDSIFLSWGPYSGVNTFNVRYGTVNGEWLYNTDVTGFSTTLNNLPANSPVWVEVAARSYCTIGDYGPSKRLGDYGPAKLVGSPKLPDTGLSEGKVNFTLYILIGVLTGVSILLIAAQRKYRIFRAK